MANQDLINKLFNDPASLSGQETLFIVNLLKDGEEIPREIPFDHKGSGLVEACGFKSEKDYKHYADIVNKEYHRQMNSSLPKSTIVEYCENLFMRDTLARRAFIISALHAANEEEV